MGLSCELSPTSLLNIRNTFLLMWHHTCTQIQIRVTEGSKSSLWTNCIKGLVYSMVSCFHLYLFLNTMNLALAFTICMYYSVYNIPHLFNHGLCCWKFGLFSNAVKIQIFLWTYVFIHLRNFRMERYRIAGL